MNHNFSSNAKVLIFRSIYLLTILIILPIKCDKKDQWTRKNERNISEGYISSSTTDYWRRWNPNHSNSHPEYKDAPFAFHTFVTVNDPTKNEANKSTDGFAGVLPSKSDKRTDDASEIDRKNGLSWKANRQNALPSKADRKKSDFSKMSTHKKKHYTLDEKSHFKTFSNFENESNNSKRKHGELETKRSFTSQYGGGRKYKVTRKDKEDFKSFRSQRNNNKAGERQKFKNRYGHRKISDIYSSKYIRHPDRRKTRMDNEYPMTFHSYHQRHLLDKAHFLPLFEQPLSLLKEDESATNLDSFEGEYDVPPIHTIPRAAHLRRKRPNIILMMTDDLDVELGSLKYMPRLQKLMGEEGALFSNAYTTTPMCCPSRSSMLTGMYIHNHQVYTNHQNCSSPQWQRTHERRSFASYLNNAGYNTAYIGKYLNRYNGSHVPPGWKEWAALLMNSRYYNYTINRNSHHVKYGNRYPHDYYPHVITNDGVKFLKSSSKEEDPFLLVLSYPSPHGPEDSAPEHSHKFFNASDHHTASYNYAPNPDKQWMLQFTDRMPDIQVKYSDLLMTKRLQTLQSVDEAVEKIINSIQEAGLENNTYLFFTSDHGYHLGQFGLAKGKSMPFEFDVKVPFFVRGPGIKPGSNLPQIALNVDLAPTFLDIAGLPRPPQMDGRSLLPVMQSSSAPEDAKYVPWRDSFLIESSGRLREEEELEKKEIRTYEREKALSLTLLKATSDLGGGNSSSFGEEQLGGMNLYTSKHERLEEVCQRIEFSFPCKHDQKWHCVKVGYRWKIRKCRRQPYAVWQKHCICQFTQGFGTFRKLDGRERRKQRNFLRKYVTKDFHTFDPKFIKAFNNINVPIQFGPRNLHHKINRRRNGRKRYKRSNTPSNENVTDIANEHEILDETRNHPIPHFYLKELEESDDAERGEDVKNDLKSEDPNIPKEDFVSLTFHETDSSVHDFVEEEELRDIKDQIFDIADEIATLKIASSNENDISLNSTTVSTESSSHGCKSNDGHIDCQDEVYANMSAWRSSKDAIEDKISRLNQQLLVMKNILHHLQDKKPDLINIYENEDYNEETDETYENEHDEEYFDGEANIEDNEADHNTDAVTDVGDSSTIVNKSETVFDNEEEKDQTEDAEDSKQEVRVDDEDGKAVTTYLEHPDRGLTLPVVGLDLPLIEDVPYPGKKVRKYKSPSKKHDHPRKSNFDRKPDFADYGEYSDRTQNKKLYYPISIPPMDNEVSGNDAMQSRLCWCDRRIIKKIAIQEARERKRQERQKIKEKRQMRKMRRKNKEKSVSCNYSTLNCYTHDNDHWRTPPLWTDGQFCFCINSANNTYWCLRTINATHNFLYCEFITGLITYYDLHIDPYQLRNVAFTLSNERVLELNKKLTSLRGCKGADECDGWVSREPEDRDKNAVHPNQSKTEDKVIKTNFLNEDDEETNLPSFDKKKVKKLQERERRKKLKKERKRNKKLEKLKGYLGSIPENPFAFESEIEHIVRLPRKSRHKSEKKLRKERKRQRRKRKREKKRISRMRKKRGEK